MASRGLDRRRRWSAPFRRRNYVAFVNSFRTYVRPIEGLRRYVYGSGTYPWVASIKTPLGQGEVLVPHPHDVRTVNEVFCRRDYGSSAPRVVADVGGNIGVAALYFLTRRPDSVVHVWEPHPGNLPVLRANLAHFADRCRVHEAALAPTAVTARFTAEPIGRYSGLTDFMGVQVGEVIEVVTEEINAALREVIEQEGGIDLLKVDTEGSEPALLAAVEPHVWARVKDVVYELPGRVVHATGEEFLAGRPVEGLS